MNAIVCIDDVGGMMFNHRRQSQDSALRAHIAELTSGYPLWMNAYSARQFGDMLPENAVVDEDFLARAGTDDFCFVENADLEPVLDRIAELIVYRWNRDYPRDTILPADLGDWILVSSENFAGSSHDEITQEVYTR